jgi:microcystin-dependent protein
MAQPYVGEIRMFAGNFAPAGWMLCEGQLLPISENEVLFQLIGTTYGGDGESTFALPNLSSRVPAHQGNGVAVGEQGGVETVTLNVQQIPGHGHQFMAAATDGNQISAAGALPANSLNLTPYINQPPDTSFNSAAVSPAGGSQPHENLQPFLCINFIISLFGIFPSPT